MPGYLVHLACCNPVILRHFVPIRIGIEAPDLLRAYNSRFGIEGAEEKWNQIRTHVPDIPNFECMKPLLLQEGGTHFGKSSDPDIKRFWNSLSKSDKETYFWRGYLWHLLTDAVFYQRLNFRTLMSVKVNLSSDDRDASIRREREELHRDFYATPEICDLDIVKFDTSEPKYVSEFILITTIEELRGINPLISEKSLERIVHTLLND